MPKLDKAPTTTANPAAKSTTAKAGSTQKPRAELKPTGATGKNSAAKPAKAVPSTDVATLTHSIPVASTARPTPAWKNKCQYCVRPMPDNRDVLICGRCANTVATAKQGKPKGFYLHGR